MAAAGAGRLRRAASALLLRSPRLPARELSAPARLYHKKVGMGNGVRGVRTDREAGVRGPSRGLVRAGAGQRPSLGRSGRGVLRRLGTPSTVALGGGAARLRGLSQLRSLRSDTNRA